MEITNNLALSRFETVEEGTTAYLSYELFPGIIELQHTIVPRAIEGRGIAARLTDFAVAYARSEGLLIRPVCSYSVRYFERHAELGVLLAEH